jgi:Predicted unsaturated glucuronyl hydrolase involved in regulation of bacterial surface properties, and related proteins
MKTAHASSSSKKISETSVAAPGADPLEIAVRAFDKHVETNPLGHYTGIVSLHGLGRLGLFLKERSGDVSVLEKARTHYGPFLRGEEKFKCNFPNYHIGGNGAAYLWWKGELTEESEKFAYYVDELMTKAPRDRNGICCHPRAPQEEMIWIDVAFAVTPFLLFCGLKMNRPDCIDEAWAQTRKMVATLRVAETGLVNQAINFRGVGHRSADHWSRGNGWAMLALAELVQFFPETHPERPAVVKMYLDFIEACMKARDEVTGLWHQEMTAPESYIETSGSGLILYGIGAGLELGLLGETHREAFETGLRSLLSYIALDGSVHHTCVGCLSPGQGTREDYIGHPHRLNDCHAFGPLVLAFGQAARLGVALK